MHRHLVNLFKQMWYIHVFCYKIFKYVKKKHKKNNFTPKGYISFQRWYKLKQRKPKHNAQRDALATDI